MLVRIRLNEDLMILDSVKRTRRVLFRSYNLKRSKLNHVKLTLNSTYYYVINSSLKIIILP